MVLGLLTALSPFLGLPYSWLMWALPVFGLLVFLLACMLELKRRTAQSRIEKEKTAAFSTHEEPTSF